MARWVAHTTQLMPPSSQVQRTGQTTSPLLQLDLDCMDYMKNLLMAKDLAAMLSTSWSLRAVLLGAPVYELWACKQPQPATRWFVSDGAHVGKLLDEGMHFERLVGVVQRNVISPAVVQKLLTCSLRPLRRIDLQGDACSPVIIRLLASSTWVTKLTELHLGYKCLHPRMQYTGKGMNELCHLLEKTTALRKLTLPDFVDFERVGHALNGRLRVLCVRMAWNTFTVKNICDGIHVLKFHNICFDGLRSLYVDLLAFPNPSKPFPALNDVSLPELEMITIKNVDLAMPFNIIHGDVQRPQIKAFVLKLLECAPKLKVLRLPAPAATQSLLKAMRDARRVHGPHVHLIDI